MGFKRIVLAVAMMAAGLTVGIPMMSAPVFAADKSACPESGCMAADGNTDAVPEKDFRRAQEGDAGAELALGLRFLMGNGLPADEALAQEWLLKAAKQDNAAAQVTLGAMLAFESDKQDLPAAAMWFEKAARAGNVQAMSELVRLLETGRGVGRDMAKAEEWRKLANVRGESQKLDRTWKMALAGQARWMKVAPEAAKAPDGEGTPARGTVVDMAALGRAAENGDDHAQVVLGALLAKGEGGEGGVRDEAAALDWFRKAADAGNSQAQAVLGELYGLGWGGLKKDGPTAARWMEKAALGGLVPAEAEWGSMLMEGRGVKKDPAKGLSWIAKAAQEGDGRAGLAMASVMLGQGEREAAAKWFAGVAQSDDPDVLSALGAFYGWGDGPVAGESEKLSEVRRYAQRDESEAQLMMGFLYGEGWGARRDPVKAEYWFGKAAAQNDPEVWLPLGLLYAETGRDDKAAAAFGKAVASGGFSLAIDGELLQLIFVDSERMPDLGSAMKHPASAKKAAGATGSAGEGKKTSGTDKNVPDANGRSVRVSRKRAFLENEVKKGNPAAQLMMSTIVAQGWGVEKDGEKARLLRSEGIRGMCAALKEKAADESLCAPDEPDTRDEVTAPASGNEAAGGDSNVFRVTEGAK